MNKTTFISKIQKRTNIKVVMLILVLLVGFVHPVFAQTSADTSFLDGLSSLLTNIINIGSRAWIPLATLAGKFMSNDMVYGSRFHLDNYLWQMWNISKNFANFGLLGLLLYKIIGFITGKEKNVQSIIGKAVIAGILIQMSWFLVGAIADISTIATTALGSFPASILSSTDAGSKMDNMIETNIRKGIIVIDKQGNPKRSEATVSNDQRSTADIKNLLMPRYDSVGGPLIFIGASALHIQDMMGTSSDQKKDAKSTIINFGLKGIILLLYVVMLALLLIANIIRVGYLRVFIAISPIMILMSTFFKSDKGLGDKGFLKNLSLDNFIAIMFKPVIFVGIMGLILIFITSIQSMLVGGAEINGTTMTQTANGSTMEIQGVAKVTTNETLNQSISTVQSTIPNLIVYLATLFLLRLLVKTALSSGSDPIASAMKSGTKFIEHSAQTIPLTNGLSIKSGETMRKTILNETGKQFGFEELGNMKSRSRGSRIQDQTAVNTIRGFVGGKVERTDRELETLEESVRKGENFLENTKQMISVENHEGLIPNTAFYNKWEGEFKKWIALETSKTGLSKQYTELKDISPEDWKIIHGKLDIKGTAAPKNYEEFRKISYQKAE